MVTVRVHAQLQVRGLVTVHMPLWVWGGGEAVEGGRLVQRCFTMVCTETMRQGLDSGQCDV